MTQVIEMGELQELKEQFILLNEKLEKQKIINETLIKESMTQKISYVEKVQKRNFIITLLVSPLMIALLLLNKAHWAFVLFVLVALGIEGFLHYRAYRILTPKKLMDMGFVDAMERVSRFKRFSNIVTWVMAIPALIIFVMFIGLITNYTFHFGTIIYYGVFVSAAMIWEYVRKRKMYARLDEVLKQINELREN